MMRNSAPDWVDNLIMTERIYLQELERFKCVTGRVPRKAVMARHHEQEILFSMGQPRNGGINLLYGVPVEIGDDFTYFHFE